MCISIRSNNYTEIRLNFCKCFSITSTKKDHKKIFINHTNNDLKSDTSKLTKKEQMESVSTNEQNLGTFSDLFSLFINTENEETNGENENNKNNESDQKEENEKDKNNDSEDEFRLSSSSLLNAASETYPHNFYFNVNGKKYYCYSSYADFLSPLISKIHHEDPSVDHFDINLRDIDDCFPLVFRLMYGEEINPNPIQERFLYKIGEILENTELMNAFCHPSCDISGTDAIRFLIHKSEELEEDERSQFISIIAQNMYLLTPSELKSFELSTLVQIFNNPKLTIFNEEKLLHTILELIKDKGDSYKVLLSAVGFQNLSPSSMKEFIQIINPTSDFTPELWSSLSYGLTLKSTENRIYDRYIKKEISIPYKGNPHNGIFTYLRKCAGNKNPVDAGLVYIKQDDRECSIPPKTLLDYGSKSRWFLQEKENNCLTFDFKDGKIALGGYTITSGLSSSYWEYPTSWTWEGSNDNRIWEEIDVKTHNSDLGDNEKTYTWTCPLSNLYRYVRFRLRDVVKRGGLYCREFELFGSYLQPENMKDIFNKPDGEDH